MMVSARFHPLEFEKYRGCLVILRRSDPIETSNTAPRAPFIQVSEMRGSFGIGNTEILWPYLEQIKLRWSKRLEH